MIILAPPEQSRIITVYSGQLISNLPSPLPCSLTYAQNPDIHRGSLFCLPHPLRFLNLNGPRWAGAHFSPDFLRDTVIHIYFQSRISFTCVGYIHTFAWVCTHIRIYTSLMYSEHHWRTTAREITSYAFNVLIKSPRQYGMIPRASNWESEKSMFSTWIFPFIYFNVKFSSSSTGTSCVESHEHLFLSEIFPIIKIPLRSLIAN